MDLGQVYVVFRYRKDFKNYTKIIPFNDGWSITGFKPPNTKDTIVFSNKEECIKYGKSLEEPVEWDEQLL